MSRAKRTGSTDTRGCAWTTAYDGAREERRYMCPNWRADVSAIVTSAGKLAETGKNSAYGTAFGLPAGDTDSNGTWDATDSGNTTSGSYEVRKDSELNGTNDANDVTYSNSIKGTYQTLGYGVLSSTAVGNRKGYGGYEADIYLSKLDHVRNRVLDTVLGRWTRRDPAGYTKDLDLYAYGSLAPIAALDPQGLLAEMCPYGDCNWCNEATSIPQSQQLIGGLYTCTCYSPITWSNPVRVARGPCTRAKTLTGGCTLTCPQDCRQTCAGSMIVIRLVGWTTTTICGFKIEVPIYAPVTIACTNHRTLPCAPAAPPVTIPGRVVTNPTNGSWQCCASLNPGEEERCY